MYAPTVLNQDTAETYLTRAHRVRDAAESGAIDLIHTEGVFTCPVRHHRY